MTTANRRLLLKMTTALTAASAAATTREQIATYAAFMREVDAYGTQFPKAIPITRIAPPTLPRPSNSESPSNSMN